MSSAFWTTRISCLEVTAGKLRIHLRAKLEADDVVTSQVHLSLAYRQEEAHLYRWIGSRPDRNCFGNGRHDG